MTKADILERILASTGVTQVVTIFVVVSNGFLMSGGICQSASCIRLFLLSKKMRGDADDGYAEDGDLLGLGGLTYGISCVLRDAGAGATLVTLRIQPAMFGEIDRGLIVSFPHENLPLS